MFVFITFTVRAPVVPACVDVFFVFSDQSRRGRFYRRRTHTRFVLFSFVFVGVLALIFCLILCCFWAWEDNEGLMPV